MSNRAPEITAPDTRKFLARLLLLAVPVIYVLLTGGGGTVPASVPNTSRVAYTAVAAREVVAPKSCPDGKVLAEDHSCVPTSFYDEPVAPRKVKAEPPRKSVAPKSCPAGKVMAEDHSCVPSSFYDKPAKRKTDKAKADTAKKDGEPRKSVAEDGSKVNAGFYDRTDYNRDGVADQDQGWSENPSPDDVKAGRK